MEWGKSIGGRAGEEQGEEHEKRREIKK